MRHSLTRTVGWSAAVVGVVVSALAGWFAVGLCLTAQGNAAHAAGDLGLAERRHAAAAEWLWVERWLAPYNLGVVHHEQGRFGDAAGAFQRATAMAPATEQCTIRLNWAHSLEAAADDLVVSGDVASAAAWYLNAEAVLADAVCSDDLGTVRDEALRRLEDKRRDDSSAGSDPDQPTDPDAAQEEELERREQSAQQQFRAGTEDRDRPEPGDGQKTW